MRSRVAFSGGLGQCGPIGQRPTVTVGPSRGAIVTGPGVTVGPRVLPPTQLVPPFTSAPFVPEPMPVPMFLPPADAPAMAAYACGPGLHVRDARGACYAADFGNPMGRPRPQQCCASRMAVVPGTPPGYYVPLAVPPQTGVIDLLHASGVGQVPGGPGTVPVPGGGCIKALSFSAMTGTVYEYGSWGCSSTYRRQPNGSYVRVTRCSCA